LFITANAGSFALDLVVSVWITMTKPVEADNSKNRGLDFVRSQFEQYWGKDSDGVENRVERVLRFFADDLDNQHRFETKGLQEVRLISVDEKTLSTRFEITAAPHLCSKFGTLHGAAAAMLLDMLTSTCLSIIAKPGYLDAGHVSRTLMMTYLRPVQEGERLIVDCRIVSAGKGLANLTGEIKTLDGKVCVSCVHDKAILAKVPSKL
jgi:acyl-coenzyme A thioesterase 13